MTQTFVTAAMAIAAVLAIGRVASFLRTLPALALMPIVSRRLAPWLRIRHYSDADLTGADGAPEMWRRRRCEGLDRLSETLRARDPQSASWGRGLRESFSDLRFTDAS